MIFAISNDSEEVYPHFGRAPFFSFIKVENNKVIEKKVLPNPGHTIGSLPKFINDNAAEFIITGGMGRRAIDYFKQYGIEVILGITGNIDEVINRILNGTLNGGESLCFPGGGKGFGVEKIHTEADDEYKHINF